MKKHVLYTGLLSLSLIASPVFADQLVFENGDVLTGEIYHIDGEAYHFKTSFGSVIEVPKGKVISHSVGDDDTDPMLEEEIVTTETEAQEETVVQKAEEKKESSSFVYQTIENNLGLKTTGYLRFGSSLQEGNTEKSGMKFQGEVKTDLDKSNRVILRGDFAYAEVDGDVSENNRSFAGIYDHFLNEKWFVSSNAKFKTDKEAELDLQTTLGVGLGYQPYKGDDLNLSLTLGPTYLQEDFETGETEEAITGRWAVDYDQQFFDKRLKLFHNHTILQSFEEGENFQLESTTGASIPITEHFKGIAQMEYDFDNLPATGSERSDTTYSLNLGYEW